MIDTGKDAIDVVATVTAKVGETMVEEGTQGVGGLLKLLLKLLQSVLQKVADKIANRNGKRKIETLMRNGDSTSFLELPANLDQKHFQKQMQRQGKKLAFQFSLTKSGDNCILTYKDKDAQVVSLAFQNLRREAIRNGKTMPDIEMPNIVKNKEQQKEYPHKTAESQYEPIKVARDQGGNFVYSRGDISMVSKGEKSEVTRQRLQDTFGLSEKGAFAVWNQGLDKSRNQEVANRVQSYRQSITKSIDTAKQKQSADMAKAARAPAKAPIKSTQKVAPAGIAR